MVKQIFVNLPVKDLDKSKNFFRKLGFEFNPDFTDEKGACLILGENIFNMLLTEPFFTTFLKNKNIADTSNATEVLTAVSVESRQTVDALVDKALQNGATPHRDADDYGWMYSRNFQDLDGHIWEVLYGDEEALKQQMANK